MLEKLRTREGGLIEIIAVVVGVVLTAFLAIRMGEHRSLITYDVIRVPAVFGVKNTEIVPAEDVERSHLVDISAYCLKIVNRGRRSADNVTMHAAGKICPESIRKEATSISPESISVDRIRSGIEIKIDFLPPKEEIKITFVTSDRTFIFQLAGTGASYTVKSEHFYVGQKGALSAFKTFFITLAIGSLIVVVAALYRANERLHDANERLYSRGAQADRR